MGKMQYHGKINTKILSLYNLILFKSHVLWCVKNTHMTYMYDFKFYYNIYDCSVIQCLHIDEIFSSWKLNYKQSIA